MLPAMAEGAGLMAMKRMERTRTSPTAQRMDRSITIQALTVSVDSDSGQPVRTFADWKTDVPAGVTPWQGREFTKAGQISAEVDTRFHIRWVDGLSPTMRIAYDGVYYEIYRIEEVGRKDRANIFAKGRSI